MPAQFLATPKMKNLGFLLLVATAASAAKNIVLNTVLQGGSDDRSGYVLVTYIADDGLSSTGIVCGPLDAATSAAVCNSRGWHRVVASGTVTEFGMSAPGSDHNIELKQMTCTGVSATAQGLSYSCTYQTASNISTCSLQQAAAVTCVLNDGEVAAIVVVVVVVALLIATIPVVIVLVYLFKKTAPPTSMSYKKHSDEVGEHTTARDKGTLKTEAYTFGEGMQELPGEGNDGDVDGDDDGDGDGEDLKTDI